MGKSEEGKQGRPVVLTPSPRGLWWVILGGSTAVLAPMFGFLVGTIIGETSSGAGFTPVYLGLFVGVVIGAFGVLAVLVGGWRLYAGSRARAEAAE